MPDNALPRWTAGTWASFHQPSAPNSLRTAVVPAHERSYRPQSVATVSRPRRDIPSCPGISPQYSATPRAALLILVPQANLWSPARGQPLTGYNCMQHCCIVVSLLTPPSPCRLPLPAQCSPQLTSLHTVSLTVCDMPESPASRACSSRHHVLSRPHHQFVTCVRGAHTPF